MISTITLTLAPGSSTFRVLNVAKLVQFEVQIKTNSNHVLVSGWGKNVNGRLVAAHRFTPTEFAKNVVHTDNIGLKLSYLSVGLVALLYMFVMLLNTRRSRAKAN